MYMTQVQPAELHMMINHGIITPSCTLRAWLEGYAHGHRATRLPTLLYATRMATADNRATRMATCTESTPMARELRAWLEVQKATRMASGLRAWLQHVKKDPQSQVSPPSLRAYLYIIFYR